MFTALLIAILIVTGAATVVGGGLVLAAARRRELSAAPEHKQLPAAGGQRERGVADLRPGDIIQRESDDYLVEGVIRFDEDGHRWLGARLTDGTKDCWLYVGMERMGSVSKRWLEHDPGIELSGFPPEKLVVGAERYSLEKRGTATAKLIGDIGALPGTQGLGAESVFRCRWWRYQGAGNATLVVEQWSGDYRALRGRELGDGDLEMMPGS